MMMEMRNTNNNQNNNNNTNQNSRIPNYQNTRGSITGLCERSVADHFNKIESNFLEKYLKYIVIDDFIPALFEYNIDRFQANSVSSKAEMSQSIFQVARDFELYSFIASLRAELKKNSNINQNQLIIECFGQDHQIKEGDYVFIMCQIKITNQKLKSLAEVGIEQLTKQVRSEKIVVQDNDLIHMIVFYNGDINFEFDSYHDQYHLGEKKIEMQGKSVRLAMNVFYISKVSLFQHFVQRNNYKIETIDDKTITFYELTRISFKKREMARMQLERQRQQQQQQQVQQQGVDPRNRTIPSTKPSSSASNPSKNLNTQEKRNLKYYVLQSISYLNLNRQHISYAVISAGAFCIFYAFKKCMKKKTV